MATAKTAARKAPARKAAKTKTAERRKTARTADRKSWPETLLKMVGNKRRFTLTELYEGEESLAKQFPGNKNIRATIRRTLQIMPQVKRVEDGVFALKAAAAK